VAARSWHARWLRARRVLLLLSVLFLSFSTQALAEDDAGAPAGGEIHARVTVETAPLRTGPGAGFRIVRLATRGETFRVHERASRGYWLRVELADGSLAFVQGDMVYAHEVGPPSRRARVMAKVFAPPPLLQAHGELAVSLGAMGQSGFMAVRPTWLLAPAFGLEANLAGSVGASGRLFVGGLGGIVNLFPHWPIVPFFAGGGGVAYARPNADSFVLEEGTRVRLSGQDVRRGTFSHRHAVLFDGITGRRYMPLMHVGEELSKIEVWDSPLSEAGVLGFEYGYSLDSPDALVIWEAQFGDFANTAQVIIDQFLSSSEDKWHRLSGLTLLLPHGFEGQGPEHSSARLERFLALCAEDNMQVANLTTPAQVFHCLRRQVVRPYRKPLVIMSPKSLLRHPDATSTIEDLTHGSFKRIIPDLSVDPANVRRVILCSGKVYYDLLAARTHQKLNDVALIRLEQLYPLRPTEIQEVLAPFKSGTDLVWVQEEPWNSGGWYHVNARLPAILQGRFGIRCVSRSESASPATGSNAAHKLEQERLVQEALS